MSSFTPGRSGTVEGRAIQPLHQNSSGEGSLLASLASRAERDSRAAEIVLFFLDLAKTTGDSSFLQVARLAAEYLAEGWTRSARSKPAGDGERRSSLTPDLSRTAFALAEAWKVTQDDVYRDAGLNIIRYLSAAQPASSGIVHRVGAEP